jgi:signal transduction histidine kinase
LTLDYILLPHFWRRWFAFCRIALGIASLILFFTTSPTRPPVVAGWLILLFTYAILVPWNKGMHEVWGGRLVLIFDALYFFASLWVQPDGMPWLGAGFAFLLLLSAAMLNTWVDIAGLTALSAVYLYVTRLPFAQPLIVVVLGMGLFASIVSLQRKTLLDRVSMFSQQVLILRTEAEEARSAEQKRIAADFHDGPLQSFISFQMRLEIVRKVLGKDLQAGLEELAKLQELCRIQVTELRTFVRSMRPLESGSSNLTASILRIVHGFQRESGIQVSFTGAGGSGLEDVETNTEVIQVLREALHNTQKHSNASRVLIAASRKNGSLEFTVQDDGRGFPFSGSFTLQELNALRLGPESIKRRVEELKGDLRLDSKPGKGSRLEIRLPI